MNTATAMMDGLNTRMAIAVSPRSHGNRRRKLAKKGERGRAPPCAVVDATLVPEPRDLGRLDQHCLGFGDIVVCGEIG